MDEKRNSLIMPNKTTIILVNIVSLVKPIIIEGNFLKTFRPFHIQFTIPSFSDVIFILIVGNW